MPLAHTNFLQWCIDVTSRKQTLVCYAYHIWIVTSVITAQLTEWPPFLSDEKDCAGSTDSSLTLPNVPWGIAGRAWLTIPQEIDVRKSTIREAGLGTFARTFISPNTWLGEYEGEVLTDEYEDVTTEYAWTVYRNDSLTHYVDAARVETSNWVRWVNCPRTLREENVKGVYCYGKVFYITSKPIYPGQELMVYYGHDYAEELGIDTKPFGG